MDGNGDLRWLNVAWNEKLSYVLQNSVLVINKEYKGQKFLIGLSQSTADIVCNNKEANAGANLR